MAVVELVCETCGTAFAPPRIRHGRPLPRFCSLACRKPWAGKERPADWEKMGKKPCHACGVSKPFDQFAKAKKGRLGLSSACSACTAKQVSRWRVLNPVRAQRIAKNSQLRTKYGISLEQFDTMLAAQNGLCAICGTDRPGGRGFVVDHDHTSGKIRGILCGPCNLGLGSYGDDPDVLEAAARYLRRGPFGG